MVSGIAIFLARLRDIVQVILEVWRELYLVSREHIVVLPRHGPGQMWLDQAAGEEKRFLMLLLELFLTVTHGMPVTQVLVLHIDRQRRQIALEFFCTAAIGSCSFWILVPFRSIENLHMFCLRHMICFACPMTV